MTQINPISASGTPREIICQWEIWEVDWEHEDGTSKRRRALVISSTAFNSGSNEIWFAKISTKKHEVEHRLVIEKADAAFAGTGLTSTSYFYLANARKIPRTRILQRKGRLQTFSALMTAIALKKGAEATALTIPRGVRKHGARAMAIEKPKTKEMLQPPFACIGEPQWESKLRSFLESFDA